MANLSTLAFLIQEQRADALLANAVAWDVESMAKIQGGGTVEDTDEWGILNIADGGVEEAGADRAVGFYDRGDPRRIASRRDRRSLAKVCPEVIDDAAQLFGIFTDVSGLNFLLAFADQRVDLALELFDLRSVQSNTNLLLLRPTSRTVKGIGG